ncbi:hypothetical protein ALP73_00198 [Pseudomonas coronafaciens pv. garcae]|uniref:Uncharacterized protein n=2 Tax=Pseudomonas syringae group TaxID=136849 RepID=A0AB37QII1_9PSED|nr:MULTISPECIES: hypothetical protein [Pseudomonas syringae group]KGS15264.1 hypothetical protein OA77_06700 [Pseudomonas coronafaciens]RMR94645.1 hypothetical protein ALP74_01520 [Pseudomonas coronafaciens pv. garcae]RMR98931.1 hypothetical protein ALP73_00198 [Pseudomonas coronafaciens pv. garcae]RMS12525.1 hypothetical protein ALP71_01787 [Pseudomonas coronafaciens pv. garcae]RMV01980.1 hypothetical protein ALP20_03440 [Pseudomonas coronafaciens pv. coronafaciens]
MGAPKLNDTGIDKAVRLLDGWTGKLTWDRYLAMLEVEIGHKYTKAAMLRHPRIKSAWGHAKELARDESGVPVSRSAIETEKALERVRLLEGRVERLTRENQVLLEQFVRWSHNALRKGMSLAELEAPLPYAKPKEIR